jgi:hypothetical protein
MVTGGGASALVAVLPALLVAGWLLTGRLGEAIAAGATDAAPAITASAAPAMTPARAPAPALVLVPAPAPARVLVSALVPVPAPALQDFLRMRIVSQLLSRR